MKLSILSGLTIIVAAGTLACSDSTSPAAGRPVSVSFSTAASSAAAPARIATLGASRDVAAAPATDALVITKVQLVVARMELKRSGATCGGVVATGDDEVDEHECPELQVAPSVVEVPVNGTVVSPFTVNIPAGSYSALEAKIRPVRADNDHGAGSTTFLTAHPELNGVSVVVEGTFNGTAFTYKGAPRAEFEREFNPPLVVDDKPLNVTVNLDLASWFKTQSGTAIDPSTANTGGANAAIVAENIRRSFRAFRDNDRDGHDDDDHGGH
jgi:hypothetical protein